MIWMIRLLKGLSIKRFHVNLFQCLTNKYPYQLNDEPKLLLANGLDSIGYP